MAVGSIDIRTMSRRGSPLDAGHQRPPASCLLGSVRRRGFSDEKLTRGIPRQQTTDLRNGYDPLSCTLWNSPKRCLQGPRCVERGHHDANWNLALLSAGGQFHCCAALLPQGHIAPSGTSCTLDQITKASLRVAAQDTCGITAQSNGYRLTRPVVRSARHLPATDSGSR